jgi:hypothetical protein
MLSPHSGWASWATLADESESPAYAAAESRMQAAKETFILRIEYKPPERHIGSLVVEQTAQQMLPRLHETRIGRRDSRFAHRKSETSAHG